jgi:hypothetical protein
VPLSRASTRTSPVLHDEPAHRTYNQTVRESAWRRGLARLLFVFLFAVSVGARASADSIPTTDSPIIFIQPLNGNVTIHTWNQPTVQIDADPTVQYNHPNAMFVAQHPQAFAQQMLWAQTIDSPDGQLALAAEPFALQPLPPGPHDAISIRGQGDVTLTVPSNTALIVARVRSGEVSIENYHGGQFVVNVGVGSVRLTNVQGTGAVQLNNGPMFASNSSFDRLRARTGRGNQFYENCSVAQIQASSLMGSIVYDNGTFTQGLAHFESQRGSVALGVSNGDAQITAHSDAGRVFNEAQGFTRGGPVVTATTGSGAVIYYRGSLREHPRLLMQLPANARPFRRRPPVQH